MIVVNCRDYVAWGVLCLWLTLIDQIGPRIIKADWLDSHQPLLTLPIWPNERNEIPQIQTLRDHLQPPIASAPSCIAIPYNAQPFHIRLAMIQLQP